MPVEGWFLLLLEEGSGLALFPSFGARRALSTPTANSPAAASAISLITPGNAPNPACLNTPDLPGTLNPAPACSGQGAYPAMGLIDCNRSFELPEAVNTASSPSAGFSSPIASLLLFQPAFALPSRLAVQDAFPFFLTSFIICSSLSATALLAGTSSCCSFAFPLCWVDLQRG